MYKITLPLPFTGERYGVRFKKGVGEISDEWLALHLRDAGHSVELVGEHDAGNKIQAKEKILKPAQKAKKQADSVSGG